MFDNNNNNKHNKRQKLLKTVATYTILNGMHMTIVNKFNQQQINN